MPKIVLLIVAVIFITSCSSQIGDTDSLAGLQAMANSRAIETQKKVTMGRIRETGLKEIALSLGAQSGLAWHAKIIDEQLVRQARTLDAVFDFNALILEHNILPPVLLEGRNTFNLADTQTIRISDRTYKVFKQARFISAPPNWRQYLWMDYKKPDLPHVSLLPKTRVERELWCFYVEKGWKKGMEQASVIFEENVARINEDFKGMILYRKLLAMNMISPPFVSHVDLGITGDGSEMHIDDRVLRITALPALNVNSQDWIAPVTKDENALEKLNALEQSILSHKIVITSKAWQPVIAPE